MNNSTNHSITKEMKKRAPMLISMLILAGMILLNALVKAPGIEPDSVHPMANANVTWEQTFRAGSWE